MHGIERSSLGRRGGLGRVAVRAPALVLAIVALMGAHGLFMPSWARAQAANASGAPPGRRAPAARIDVLVLEDPATDWGRRVRGQLSDLPASTRVRVLSTLERRDTPTDDPIPASAASLTAWLTSAPGAEVPSAEGTFIALWLEGAPRPSTRRLAGAWSTLNASDRSAMLELAALAVRGAVRSLLLDRATDAPAPSDRGATRDEERDPPEAARTARASARKGTGFASDDAGVTRADTGSVRDARGSEPEDASGATSPPTLRGTARDEPNPPPTPATGDSDSDGGVARDAPDESSFPLRFGLELGAAWQFYGRTAAGDPGLRAGVSLSGDVWSVTLLGHYGWSMPARLGPAEFELQRRALIAELGALVVETGAWRLSPLARAGLSWLGRDDTRGGDGAALDTAQSARYRSPFFGIGALAEARLSEALSLALRGALNVETAIPTFTLVDTAGERVSSASPWNVQPSLELGARWRW